MAAISASKSLIGDPLRRRAATICAKDCAALLSNGKMRDANNAMTRRAAASSSFLRRLAGSIATPRRISASVIAVVKRSRGFSRAIHTATARSGEALMTSESTFVSSTIMVGLFESRRFPDWFARRYTDLDAAKRLHYPTDRLVEVCACRD